jgi:hypothetical protein
MWRAPQGAFGLAEATDQPGIYEIVYMQRVFPYVLFQAAQNRGSNDQYITATVLKSFGHGNLAVPVDGQNHFQVWDEQNMFPDVVNGSKGIAIYDEKDNKYRAVIAEQVVLFATALTDSALNGPSGSINTSSFLGIGTSVFNKNPPTIPTTVDNPYNHRCATNKKVLLMRKKVGTSIGWDIVDAEKQEMQVLTSLRVSTGSGFLQGNVRYCAIEASDLSDTWVNLIPVDTCSTTP